MKNYILITIVFATFVVGLALHSRTVAAEPGGFQKYEFVTIRWGGRENTHLIRSNGKVEFLRSLLNSATRPDRTDERSFYMNIAMNAAAREGYEFAGMTNDEIVMKRVMQP
jgi:hypothetical protein